MRPIQDGKKVAQPPRSLSEMRHMMSLLSSAGAATLRLWQNQSRVIGRRSGGGCAIVTAKAAPKAPAGLGIAHALLPCGLRRSPRVAGCCRKVAEDEDLIRLGFGQVGENRG